MNNHAVWETAYDFSIRTSSVTPPAGLPPRPHLVSWSVVVGWLALLTLLSTLAAAEPTLITCDGSVHASADRPPPVQPPGSVSPAATQEAKPVQPFEAVWLSGYSKQQGLFLQSPSSDLLLQSRGLLQVDYRTFPGGQNMTNPGVVDSRVVVQRARPTLIACAYREVKLTVTPDFGNGLATPPRLFIATAEWDRFRAARLAFGLQKVPAALEVVQSIQHSPFMERSLVRDLVPLIAIGGSLSGLVLEDRLDYQVGFWNDAGSGNIFQVGKVFGAPTTLSLRFFVRPFLHEGPEWLRGLGVGFAMTQGWIFDSAGQFPMQTETFSYTFFQLNGNVTGGGPRSRYMPQASWYWNRFGFLTQYVLKDSRYRIVNGPSGRFTSDAWSVQGSMMLTDDQATFGQVKPKRPFSITEPGHWGAWQLAARYAQIDLDPSTFSLGFSDPTTNAQRARSSTVSLSWYMYDQFRATAHYVHTDFTGATAAYTAASHEDALMFRMQVTY